MPRVDLYVDQFDTLISQKGMRVMWEEAMSCGCIDEITGQPDYNCSVCKGSGFIYLAPKETKMVTTNLNNKFDWENTGGLQRGTAYATTLSTILMGYHDRITFPDFCSKFSEVLTFVDGKSSKLHKPAKEVIAILDSSASYEIGIDYKIADDGYYLEWINPLTWPIDTTRIPVLYKTSPSYVVLDTIHELRATWVQFKYVDDTFKELPKQFLIKREDFIYESDSNRIE